MVDSASSPQVGRKGSAGSISNALIVCFPESAIGQLSDVSYELFRNDEVWCESLRQTSPDRRIALEMREHFADDWHEIDFGHFRKRRVRGGRAVDQDHTIDPC